MIDINDAIVRNLTVHRVSGEPNRIDFGQESFSFTDIFQLETLKRIFLRPMQSETKNYEFKHEIDLKFNPVFNILRDAYNGEDFVGASQKIISHLSSVSRHPNINDGEVIIIKFDDIKFDGTFYEGIGIYKIENKDGFLEVLTNSGAGPRLNIRQGIGLRRPDKSCLVLFSKEPYIVFLPDRKGGEAEYWNDQFLDVVPRQDHFNLTMTALNVARKFVTEELGEHNRVSKAEQIDYLNRSVDFFKNQEHFNRSDFEKEVFQDEGIIARFRDFNDNNGRDEGRTQIRDAFSIAPQIVKKQAKLFKNVLKLDKNFDIYIHGGAHLVTTGIESDGRKYYKFYFDNEY